MNINIFKIFNTSISKGYLFLILLHILLNAFSYIILKPIHLCTNWKEVELEKYEWYINKKKILCYFGSYSYDVKFLDCFRKL